MTAQLEIFRPAATDPNVAWLADFLLEYGGIRAEAAETNGWITARQILSKIPAAVRDANPDCKIDDRTIRSWAEAAAPKVISGQRGYKHTDHATPEEINAFINTMRSQAKRMLVRSNCVRKYAHARIG